MAQAAIAQGNTYNNNNKERLIKQGFRTGSGSGTTTANKEGFSGMLGPNAEMDDLNAYDHTLTSAKVNNFNNNIAQYGTDYASLTAKTSEYINNTTNTTNTEKNYNVFINKSQTQSQISDANQQGCVTAASVSSLSLSSDFAAAYPANFLNYAAAKDACKLWAADSGKTVFAINKDSVGKYQCSTGTTLPTALQKYTVPKTLYTVLTGKSTSAQGGLFSNGQIGVWAGLAPGMNHAIHSVADLNLQNSRAITFVKKYNDTTYSSSDPSPIQETITNGWWGNLNWGTNQQWGYNMFPNSIAWWIGNPVGSAYTGNYGAGDGTYSYFYYIYNAPAAIDVYIYTVAVSVIKINGTDVTMPAVAHPNGMGGFSVQTTLPKGINVFEVKLPTALPNSCFIMYVTPWSSNVPVASQPILFKTGDAGWKVTTTQLADYSFLVQNNSNPNDIMTVNSVPAGYSKCDPLIGGGINKNSINASFGRNCTGKPLPAVNIRYIKIKANPQGECLQIAQVVVNSLVNGVITNVAPRGTTSAPDTYANGYGGSNKDRPIDGLSGTARNYPNIYHSACSANSWWQLDLGKDYPVTEIIYANREDCCSSRAIGTTMTATSSEGKQYGPVTLTGAMVQFFNTSSGKFASAPTITDVNTRSVVGNNGTVTCNRYCTGASGISWNNELPDWKGAYCMSAGVNGDIPCNRPGVEPGKSILQCQCARNDPDPWNAGPAGNIYT